MLLNRIISKCNRVRNRQLNILTCPTHERYETGLAKTGHNFYALRGENIKNWHTKYAPIPPNYTILDGNGFDQLPSYVDFDLVLSQNQFGQFPVLKQVAEAYQIPLVTLCHTMPYEGWNTEEIVSSLANSFGDVNIFISEYSKRSWEKLCGPIKNAMVINHMIDTTEFPYKEKVRESKILTVANDYINRDHCMPAGQRILTSNGFVKIESVKVGDLVLTDSGKYEPVILTHKNLYNGPVSKIKLKHKKQEIIFTYNHKIRVFRDNQWKYIEAGRLRPGEKLRFPKIVQTNFVPIDPDYAYLIGNIIADGSISEKGNIEICFALHEKDRMIHVKSIIDKLYGSSNIQEKGRTNKNIYGLSYSNKNTAAFIKSEIGGKSYAKNIPNNIFLNSDKIRCECLRGLWHCDGTFKNGKNKQSVARYSTISPKLASQVSALLLHFGIKNYISKDKQSKSTYTTNFRYIYNVNVKSQHDFEKCLSLINNGIYDTNTYEYEIGSINIEDDYNDYVYNVSVANDPSYVVEPGFVSHNCLNFSQYVKVTEGLPTFPVGDTEGFSKKAESMEQLVEFYNSFKIFLNTAHVSPIPMSVLEAMACGNVVVSCNTCAIPEYIEHGVNGFLAESDEDMRQILEMLLITDEKYLEHIRKNAAQTIKDKCSPGTFAGKWNKLLYEVANAS